RIGAVRSTRGYESQLFDEATRRVGTSPARRRAHAPTVHGASPHGSATVSPSIGANSDDGRSARASTSVRVTSFGASKTRTAPRPSAGANATTVFVVPRSIPTTKPPEPFGEAMRSLEYTGREGRSSRLERA